MGLAIAKAIDAIPVVASIAARDAMFPVPNTNQRVENLETAAIERWTGTQWVQDFVGAGGGSGGPASQLAINAYWDGATWRASNGGSAWVIWQDAAGNMQIGASGGALAQGQAFTPIPGFEIPGAGQPQAPTANPGDNSNNVSTTAWVTQAIAPLAPINSPVFTGTPTAPTPSSGDNSNRVATTAFVTAASGGTSSVFVSVTAYNATGNGTTDDTTNIQAAITANPGAVIWFPPTANYYKISDKLTTAGAFTTFLGSPGAVIKQTGTTGGSYDPDILQINHSDCQVIGLSFIGAGRSDGTGNNGNGVIANSALGTGSRLRVERCKFLYLGVAAIDIAGCTNCVIAHNDVNGATDETGTTKAANFQGIWVRNISSTAPLDCLIVGNTIRYCANEAIPVAVASRVSVVGNVLRDSYAGVAFYGSSAGNCTDCVATGNVISNIDIGSPIGGIFMGALGGGAGRTQRITVSGNTLNGCTGIGIWVATQGTQSFPVTTGTSQATTSATATTLTAASSPGWTANQWAGYLVLITAGTGINQVFPIYSNTSSVLTIVSATDGQPWATTPDATSTFQIIEASNTDNVITGNAIYNNSGDAIQVGGARVVVSGNTVRTVSGGHGIALGAYSMGCLVSGNDVRNVLTDGIATAGAVVLPNVVAENYVDQCGGYAFNLNSQPTSGSRYRGNVAGPTNGTGSFSAGAEVELFTGGAGIGQGPSTLGYLAWNLGYDGAAWRPRVTGDGWAAWADSTNGLLHLAASNGSHTIGTAVTLVDALQVDSAGNVTIKGNFYKSETYPVESASYALLATDGGVVFSGLTGATVATLLNGVPVGKTYTIERWDNTVNQLTIAPASGAVFQVAGATTTNSYYLGRYGEVITARCIALSAGNSTYTLESNMGETVVCSPIPIAVSTLTGSGVVQTTQLMEWGPRSVKWSAIRTNSGVSSGSITLVPALNGVSLGAGGVTLSSSTVAASRIAWGVTIWNPSTQPASLDLMASESSIVGPTTVIFAVALW